MIWVFFAAYNVFKLLVRYNGDAFTNYFPKIHRSVLYKITIELLYFWDVYDIIVWEKN